jgi:O-antigen ligase
VIGAAACVAPTLSKENYYRLGSLICWIGLLAPVAYTQVNTRENIASGAVPAHAIAAAAISAAAFIALLVAWVPRDLRLSRREFTVGLFLLVAVASASWSAYPSSTLLKSLQLSGAYALLALWIRVAGRDGVIRQLATVTHLLCISALIGYAVNAQGAMTHDRYTTVSQLNGVYPTISSDILGTVAAVALIALVARVGARWSLSPLAATLLFAGDVTVLVLARSRTAVVVALVGVAVSLLLSQRRRALTWIVAPVILLATITLYPVVSPHVNDYMKRGQSQQQFSTLTGRTHLWHVAEQAWQAQPITGYGYYTGHRLGGFADQFNFDISNIDNAWLETLLDTGLLGFVPFVLFALGGLGVAWSRRSRYGPGGAFVAAAALVLTGAAFVNPSIQTVGYTMVMLGALLLLPLPGGGSAGQHQE